MSDTKTKILKTAIQLFNKKGINKVTLRDIAEKNNISIGNLAYHYKNKDAMIAAAFRKMEKERDDILSAVQQIPSLDKIHEQTKLFIRLGKKYLFFYIDTVHILRNYPTIAQLHRAYTEQSIRYVKGILEYSVGSGNMRQEKVKGEYDRLSQAIWMIMTFWLNQLEIRNMTCNLDEENRLMLTLWDLIYPKLTPKGIENYRQVFARENGQE